MLQLSLDLNDGTSDLLEDMPLTLRRKYLTALTSQTPQLKQSTPNMESAERGDTVRSHLVGQMGEGANLRRRLSRQDAIRLSRSSSIESEGGIEITASI